jgi:3-phosphoshikimate 1-carboxyvinyltransferase
MHRKIIPSEQSIKATIFIPGSKSHTNRMLIIASLAEGTSILRNISLGDDSKVLLEALQRLGVHVDIQENTAIVHGTGGRFFPYSGEIDVGAAGTSMRFLTSLCSLVEGDIILKGSERMHERPIKDLVDALQQLGVSIEYLGKEGCPPLRIKGRKNILQKEISINGSTSSQFVSSLLMVAPYFNQDIHLTIVGKQVSASYKELTLDSMKEAGAKVDLVQKDCYRISSAHTYRAQDVVIEGDGSGAAYFWGLAAMSGGDITVKNISINSLQGDVQFVHILETMGCSVSSGNTEGSDWIRVQGPQTLRGTKTNMELLPDSAQTLAVVASVAEGNTEITGLSTLKVKETDRLEALHTELLKVGILSTITEDSITISGGTPHGAQIATYKDHRMAMSFALLGSVCDQIVIEDAEVVSKSFPQFWDMLSEVGVSSKIIS